MTVTCEAAELLLAARGDGKLVADDAGLLAGHLADCDGCRALAETLAPVTDAQGDHATLPAVVPGSYALGTEVARGGMGRILSARDLRVGRAVAIKELLAGSPAKARFEREARITARLQHPGVVPIYEIGTWADGTPFYAMRMVQGRTLHEAIADADDLAARLRLLPAVITACETIAFAHSKRVIHRDLTPSNIIVGAYGETVVIDWGLAKDLAAPDDEPDLDAGPYRAEPARSDLTAAGAVLGTAVYMPPEQAVGRTVGEPADVYALGAVLYHLLTGTAPYRGTTEQVLGELRKGPPRAIAKVTPDAPRALISIVEKAMARDADARYPHAGELAEELRRYEADRLVEAHRYTSGERMRRWVRRHRAITAAFLVLALAGTAGIAAVTRERGRVEERGRELDSQAASLLLRFAIDELQEGRSWRAAAAIAETIRRGFDVPATRFVLARAMSSVDAVVLRVPSRHVVTDTLAGPGQAYQYAGVVRGLEFSPDARRLMILYNDRIDQVTIGDASTMSFGVLPNQPWLRTPVARYTADGRHVLLDHGTVWDSGSGQLVRNDEAVTIGDASAPAFGHDPWAGWALLDDDVVDHVTATAGRLAVPPSIPLDDESISVSLAGRTFRLSHDSGREEVVDASTGHRVVISEDGDGVPGYSARHLAFCGADGRTRVWEVASLRLVASFATAGGNVDRCVVSDDGHRLIEQVGATLNVWQTSTGKRLSSIFVAAGAPSDTRFALNDSFVVAVSRSDHGQTELQRPGSLMVWDAATGELVQNLDAGGPLAVSTDSRYVAIQTADRAVIVIALEGIRGIQRFDASARGATAVLEVEGDGAIVLGLDRDGRVHVWDRLSGEEHVLPPSQQPADLSDDGSRLAACRPDGGLHVVEVAGGRQIRELDGVCTKPPRKVALSRNGKRLLVLTAERRAIVIDVETGATMLDLEPEIDDAALAGDGDRVAVCRGTAGTLHFLDGRPAIPTIKRPEADGCVVHEFVGGRDLAVMGESDSLLEFWDGTGTRLPGHWLEVSGIDREGRVVASVDGGVITLQSPEDRFRDWSFSTDVRQPITALAISPDGTFVATDQGIWSRSGTELMRWEREATCACSTIEFSRDGGSLIIVEGTTVIVRDAHVDDRSVAEVSRLVRERTRWYATAERLNLDLPEIFVDSP